MNKDEWNHVAGTYNINSMDNDPTIYINGEVITLSEAESPSGSITSDAETPLYIW